MYAIEERNSWAADFEKGQLKSYYLEQYREGRNDPFWRSTRELEKLCEYAILLEKEVKKLKEQNHVQRYA